MSFDFTELYNVNVTPPATEWNCQIPRGRPSEVDDLKAIKKPLLKKNETVHGNVFFLRCAW